MRSRLSAAGLLVGVAATGCLVGPTPGFGGGDGTGGGSSSASAGTSTTTSSDGEGGESSTTNGEPMPLQIPARGYVERPCGFDVDRDGIVGEPGECDFCDGVTEDPDGDGYAQPILYVDCDAGLDPELLTPGACTDPEAPCRTIGRAMTDIPNTSASDEQGIVCFTGTCIESVAVHSGRPHVVTRAAQGIEVRDFDYPGEPSMLIGWDRDDDGEYPPFDDDDVARLQPPPGQQSAALYFGVGAYLTPSHDVEYAHFEVSVPSGAEQTQRFMQAARSPNPHERIHLHDLSVQGFAAGRAPGDPPGVILLTMESYGATPEEVAGGQQRYLALENLEFLDHGGYLLAEHADYEPDRSGPIRLANLTTHARGCDKSDCMSGAKVSVWRMGGWVDGLEVLASVFDAGTDTWFPHAGSDAFADAGPTAIVIGECMQDVAILHNEFVGWSTATRIEANGSPLGQNVEGDPHCDGRDVDAVRIEGNLVRDSSDRLSATMVPWVLQTAHPDPARVGDDRTIASVRIYNNVVVAEHGLVGCAWMQVWGASSGPIEYMHDTCIGAIQTETPTPAAALVRVVGPRETGTDPLARLTLQGLLLGGQAEGDVAIAFDAAPAEARSDHHAFAPGATFRWQGGASIELDAWRAASGLDPGSTECVPEFFAAGDFHLAQADACAGDLAVAVDGIDFDIDGEPREPGPWDAGADERP